MQPAWLNDHRALALLSEGGVGKVFLVEHPGSGEIRAAKVMHRELVDQADAVERFLAVARALQRLSHPNVVTVFDTGLLPDGRPFFVMEYARGRDLGELLVDPAPRHHERVVRVAIDIASGLAAAHDAGLLHLDLTPSNVLLAGDPDSPTAKVVDFDASPPGAVRLGPSTDPDAIGSGTPEYWSPEQATGQPVDIRSDIYSFGVVLYELLSGRVPFHSHAVVEVVAQHLHAEPPPLTPLAGTVPPPHELREIVSRCLAKQPGERFQSARELHAALLAVPQTQAEAVGPRAASADAPAAERRSWAPALSLGIGAVVLSLGIALAVVPSGRGRSPGRSSGAAPAAPIRLALTSQPSGAFVFRADGGPTLGQTPFALAVARSSDALELVFRFPDGKTQQLRVVPDRPASVHARAPERQATSPEQGASSSHADLPDL